MAGGRITAEVPRAEATQERLMTHMTMHRNGGPRLAKERAR